MGGDAVKEILRRLAAGELTVEEATVEITRFQLLELGNRARLDIDRPRRRGLPEVVLASGKSPQDAARLLVALAENQGQGLASRLETEHWAEIERVAGHLELHRFRTAVRAVRPGFRPEPHPGRVAVLTAGTSDLIPAEEVVLVVEACGLEVRLECDLGVAGLHRLMGPLAEVVAWGADVIVVAAGMDGVLPGVVAGLIDLPVIGLPVSNGYGAGGRGKAALLTMLQSCSTGLTVVNIDNGIGAGASAALIAARVAACRKEGSGTTRPSEERR